MGMELNFNKKVIANIFTNVSVKTYTIISVKNFTSSFYSDDGISFY